MTVAEVEQAFTRKLGASRNPSGDHIYFYLTDGGLDYTVGKLSHSWSGQLDNTQIGMLAKKLHLRKRDFEQFVACTLDAPGILALWRAARPVYQPTLPQQPPQP